MRLVATLLLLTAGFRVFGIASAAELPGRYFEIMRTAMPKITERFQANPDLKTLESAPGWRHFPSVVLVAAVLHSKQHPANKSFGDPKILESALAIGDMLVKEVDSGYYVSRLDHHRDSYLWLEAYRLLEPKLGEERKARWKNALMKEFNTLATMVEERQDYPWYASPFIGTSPNHYSLWSSTLYLAGKVFKKAEWEKLGGKVMHRFAAEEQTPDGYWGEHSRSGPTTGYDYLTETAVAVYWEHSKDKAALEALRKSTEFHKYFTYPDGIPVETVNDRNRYWEVSEWGHFGFSNFPDGRRYAEFLTKFYEEDKISPESLGRIAQNATYYHDGPVGVIPQEQPRFAHQMSVPAGIRKTGPWVVCLSGIIATPTENQFYLERQSNVSLFHEKLGLVVTGANSKRQPELATFHDKGEQGQIHYMPMSSKLVMGDAGDSLAVAFDSFFSVLRVPTPSEKQAEFRFAIKPKYRKPDGKLTLQLVLKPGQVLETGAGKKITLGEESVELGPEEIGGWIRHNGWTLKTTANSSLTWPVRPFNPYANAPEKGLQHAVGAFSTPVPATKQELTFTFEVN